MWWRILIFGIFLTMAIVCVAFMFGDTLAKADYEEDYKKLKEDIDNLPDDVSAYQEIVDRFEKRLQDLYRYKCRNNEKIDVLRINLYNKIYRQS